MFHKSGEYRENFPVPWPWRTLLAAFYVDENIMDFIYSCRFRLDSLFLCNICIEIVMQKCIQKYVEIYHLNKWRNTNW